MAFHQSHSINSSPEYDDEATPLLTKKVTDKSEIPPQCCSARCNLAVLMFFGFAVVYGLRVNLSVAMVAMVNNTSPQPSSNNSSLQECPVPAASLGNQSNGPEQPDGMPRYQWDSKTQGFLLGAFFFGYLVTQIPGGYLSGRLGGRIFLGGGVVGTAALTLLTPLAADLGVTWLFALRALEGFGEGVTFPAMMAMWARWAPPLERSRLMTFSGAGANFGAFVALPLTGFICHTLGWPAVFYCCGGAGCLWGLFWFILVSDEPSSHPRISVHERDYIINSIGSQGGAHGWSVPLIPIIFSVPLWAIILAQMCSNWAYYTLLTYFSVFFNTKKQQHETQYAGVLLGITNTFGTIPGVLAPIVVGYLTKDRTLAGWRSVFCLSAGVSASGAVIFTLFGSGKIQSWAMGHEEFETETDREHPDRRTDVHT